MTEIERVFVRFRGRTIGPFTPDKLRDMVRRGQVTRMHELSGDGLSWMKADEFGNFFPQAASASMSSEMMASASDVPPGEGGMDAAMGGGPAKPVVSENATAQWYAHVNGEKQGPVSLDQMRLFAEAKILKTDSLVWKSGMDAWKPAAESIPELFGGAPASGGGGGGGAGEMLTSSSTDTPPAGDAGNLIAELTKHHALMLTLGITLLIGAAVIFGATMVLFTKQSGKILTSDYMGGTIRIALSGAAGVAGILALQTAGKLKAAAEQSSLVGAILAARSLNTFVIVSAVSMGVWLLVLLLIVIAALATNIPVLNVLL